ncbi:hypothetical protein HK103_003184 [Boothiomyces macroporosus]|uniref:Uncharacterized protein n=1 Tax=Boothiomyces macroporosus TaxID=261099 RepID=A0AAD5Y2B6_9FUNG|nr:hypothetical protein HK103_003182 [Boothiomyces macroporosus]KAJ3250761.1 hypothetical protein HK103_003184 [Boothiomyces macroporosus]
MDSNSIHSDVGVLLSIQLQGFVKDYTDQQNQSSEELEVISIDCNNGVELKEKVWEVYQSKLANAAQLVDGVYVDENRPNIAEMENYIYMRRHRRSTPFGSNITPSTLLSLQNSAEPIEVHILKYSNVLKLKDHWISFKKECLDPPLTDRSGAISNETIHQYVNQLRNNHPELRGDFVNWAEWARWILNNNPPDRWEALARDRPPPNISNQFQVEILSNSNDKDFSLQILNEWKSRLDTKATAVKDIVEDDSVESVRCGLAVVKELKLEDFWENCSRWVSFEGGISIAHIVYREKKRENLNFDINQLSTWSSIAYCLILRLGDKYPFYFLDSNGNYCMAVNCYEWNYDEEKKLSMIFRDTSLFQEKWELFELNGGELNLDFTRLRRPIVTVMRIKQCRLILPSNSLKRLIQIMHETAENTPEDYCIPETHIDGMIEKRERSPRTFILRLKGEVSIPIHILDCLDDPSWPILADLDGAFLQTSLFASRTYFEDNFLHICHVLSGDAYERQLWREYFHQLQASAIITWKKGNKYKRSEQQLNKQNMCWQTLFGENMKPMCPYCGTKIINRDEFPTKTVQQAHILPAIWGDMNDKYWWNTVPTCCNMNQPRFRPAKAQTISNAEQNGQDLRIEHMFIALLNDQKQQLEQRQKRIRNIALCFFKKLLQEHDCPITTIGKCSLIGFTLGFYCISAEPLINSEWNFLFLSPEEVEDCWKLLPSSRS